MKKIVFSIILCMTVIWSSYGQDKSSVQMELTDDTESSHSNTRNVLKLNPLLFFRGDIPIYYERSISDKLAVEGGIGFTIKDYFDYSYLYDGFAYDEEIGLGLSARIGIRYYASDYSYMQEGFYFGANVRFQNYSSTITSIENMPYNLNNNSNNIDFRFNVGYLYMLEENFFLEPYVAFGFRNRTAYEINETITGNVSTFSTSKSTDLNPIISLGCKMGITF